MISPGKLLAVHQSPKLATGLHESLITDQLTELIDAEVSREVDLGRVDEADQPHVLARHISAALHRRLASIKDPAARLTAANELLRAIEDPADSVATPIQQLHALRHAPGPGQVTRLTQRPKTPLNDAALLTNAHGEPSLASELRAEIDSADSIDLLCAFVMWHGLRLIEKELQTAREAGVPIRVVTTTYIGGTERRALDRLVSRLRRRGQSAVRRAAHAPSRQGVALRA